MALKTITPRIIALTILLPINAGLALSSINTNQAIAQGLNTYGDCVAGLMGAPAHFSRSTAADRCQSQLRSLTPYQNLQQCLQELMSEPIYFSRSTAADQCEELLAAQSTTSGNFGSNGDASSRRMLRLHNNTGIGLMYLYLSPASNSSWGNDVLGGSILNPSYFMEFTLNSSECTYDIRAELENGRVIEDQFNSCRYSAYTLR